MNNVLTIGQPRSGRKLFLKSLSNEAKTISQGLLTLWKVRNLQWITLDEDLTATNYKQLPDYQLVTIFINLPTLLDKQQRITYINWLRPQLALLNKKNCPAIFIISQSDRLLGFSDYFSHYSAEARQKAFGIDQFSDAKELIQNLSQNTLGQLHSEPLVDKRARIQTFPAQLNKTLEIAKDLITRCLSESKLTFSGLFFISTKQKHPVIDALSGQSQNIPYALNDRVFFTEDLQKISHQLTHSYKLSSKQHDKKRWLAIPLSMTLIISILSAWHLTYKHINDTIYSLKHTITSIKNNNNSPHWLWQLNKLQKAQEALNSPLISHAKFLGFIQTHTLTKRINNEYITLLTTHLLPNLQGNLTNTISKNLNQDPVQLYDALRIYLMLTDIKHRNTQDIVNWFTKYWQNNSNADVYLRGLNDLLRLNPKQWPRNKHLIDEARVSLNILPNANIAFIQLENIYTNQSISLEELLPTQNIVNLDSVYISSLFSPNNFKTVYKEQIPRIAKNFYKNNWVLNTSSKNITEDKAQLIASLQEIYLDDFSATWQNALDQLQLNKFSSLKTISSALDEITTNDSGLVSLLKFMVGNATLSKNIKPSVTVKYLDKYLQFHKYDDPMLRTQLRSFNTFITTIYKSSDSKHASYIIASSILNKNTEQNPITVLMNLQVPNQSLLAKWKENLARQTWEQLLINSRTYLNQKWQQQVLPSYNLYIKNHYPVDKTSTKDTTTEQFKSFFSQNGIIKKFFNTQLKPFVDTSQHYWVWKTYLNQQIPISQKVLNNFMRATLINQMFFANSNKPQFNFSLIPISKTPNIKNITLYFDGQALQFDRTVALQKIISWPGSKKIGASWVINSTNKKHTQKFFNGPWAALHLIQQSYIDPSNNPQKYTVTFNSKNYKWSYFLIPESKINPWLPGILHGFYCANNLENE